MLSSSPDDPALGSWLQRQLAGEGERLDQLRERLWSGAPWQRLDRALILEARSLLWALDPLEQCPEGVMIQAASGDDQLRLQAQLQVLDSIGRPELVIDDLASLAQRLEPGHRFEWLAGRHPFRQLKPQQRRQQLKALTLLAAPTAQLRLLFSQPALGPAAALLARSELPAPCANCWSRWRRRNANGWRPHRSQRRWKRS